MTWRGDFWMETADRHQAGTGSVCPVVWYVCTLAGECAERGARMNSKSSTVRMVVNLVFAVTAIAFCAIYASRLDWAKLADLKINPVYMIISLVAGVVLSLSFRVHMDTHAVQA